MVGAFVGALLVGALVGYVLGDLVVSHDGALTGALVGYASGASVYDVLPEPVFCCDLPAACVITSL